MVLATALTAALALGTASALAQRQADMSATASNGGEGLCAYQQAERRLADALNTLQRGSQVGSVEGAREALIGFQQTLTEVPDNLRSPASYRQLVCEVGEANGLFQNGNPNAEQARRELEQVVAVTSQFRAEAGLGSSNLGGGQAGADGQTGTSGGSAPASSGGR